MKAIVTGASSGIGGDMAIKLSSIGYGVILVATNKEKLEIVKNECQGHAIVYVCDLSNLNEVYKLYETFKDENIEVLVNNAGFGLFGMTYGTDLDRELKMIDVNVRAVHILTKLFLQKFMERDSGYILNVASSAGFMAGPKLNTYYATKNYVLRFTEGIYEELRRAKSNVSISVLCPGPVDTNFNNVANGSFSSKGMSSKYVGEYAIEQMFKKKLYIISGMHIKMAIFGIRFMPRKLLLRWVYNFQDKKTK